MIQMKIIGQLLFYICLVGCSRPQPAVIIINENTQVYVYDTLVIKEKLKTAAAPNAPDTTALKSYLNMRERGGPDVIELKKSLSALQLLLTKTRIKSDSQRMILQQKLDTTNLEKIRAEQEVEATKEIMYEVPIYLYLLMVIIATGVINYYKFFKKNV